MTTNVRRLLAAQLAVGCIAATAGLARAEMTACTVITTVPYTISLPGAYCLDRNLTLSGGTGIAITINASTVTLDLNGFTLDGTAGPTTRATGIFATGSISDLTVRNGRVKGFWRAVTLNTSAGQGGHLVERLQAENSTRSGIWVEGKGSIIRDNTVLGTGGTDDTVPEPIYGIQVSQGQVARIINNEVINTTAGLTQVDVVSINTGNATAAHLEANRVTNSATVANATGMRIQVGGLIEVVDNRIANVPNGIKVLAGGSPAKLRDNLTSGCTTPYQGNYVDAGNNQ